MRHIKQLEIYRKTAPLGIRFWDPVLNRQVRSGLHVQLKPKKKHGSWISARLTTGGIYAFHHLPGWREFVNSQTEFDRETSITFTQTFIIKVTDISATYRNFAFELNAPFAGIFPSAITDISMPETPGIDLFSAPTRSVPSGFGAVYVTCTQLSPLESKPASFALIKITTEENYTNYGLADKDGKALVLLPFPLIKQKLADSPPDDQRVAISKYTWDVSLSVQYAENAQKLIPGCKEPDLLSLLDQPDAMMYLSLSPVVESAVKSLQIQFNNPVVARTEERSELFIKV
ncbi:MAG: hypothetical protein DWQ10_15645 [Calditrichaeota bacterium]|nr:MAG: hypothetical protein DWQ10_15645 [Calditrichota bacterium]